MKKINIMIMLFLSMGLVFMAVSAPVTAAKGAPPTAAKTVAVAGYEKTIATVRQAVQEYLRNGVSGAAIAVRVDGKIVYSETFGLRDRANVAPVARDTQFNIGSVSKIFTAAAMLILVQEGKVKLDQPVTTYLPEFTMQDARYKDITVRMLLNHSSGFPGSNLKDAMTTVQDKSFIQGTLDNLKTSQLKHKPGEISIYCNDGFTVAQALIEKVSGESYPDFLESRIFSKLGMKHTSVYFKKGNQNIARYYEGDSQTPYPLEYVNTIGSGGLSSTAEDLTRYAKILSTDAILNPEMRAEYVKPQYGPKTVPVGEALFNVGLGWDSAAVREYESLGLKVLTKSGGTYQYFAQLHVVPAQKIAVATTFVGFGDPGVMNNTVLRALLEEKGIIAKPAPKIEARAVPVPDDYRRYEGVYSSVEGTIKLEMDPGKKGMLVSALTGKGFEPSYLFEYKDDGNLYMPSGEAYTFAADSQGEYLMLQADDRKSAKVIYEKLKPLKPVDASAFEGKAWVPLNIKVTDMFAVMVRTGSIPGADGYIYAMIAAYKANALQDAVTAVSNCRYVRDEVSWRLEPFQGKTALAFQGYYYGDAAAIPTFDKAETITIGAAEFNEARLLAQDTLLKFIIPVDGRIIIFSKDLQFVYDSLLLGNQEVAVEKGSYLIAVGKAGTRIRIDSR